MHHETDTGRALREAAQRRAKKIMSQYNAVEVAMRTLNAQIASTTNNGPAVARMRLRRRLLDQRRGELLRQHAIALADLDALCPAGPLCPHELHRSIHSTRKPRVLTGEVAS